MTPGITAPNSDQRKTPKPFGWVFFFGAGQGTLTPGLILGKDAL